MRTLHQFSELVDSVCNRRHMYVCGGSFYEVCAFILGYAAAMEPSPLGQDHETSFNAFVIARLGYPQKLAWPYVLKAALPTDEHAVDKLRDLLSEYIKAVRNACVSDLIAEARSEVKTRDADLPEQTVCWRQFNRALHRADKDVIKSLIIDHENASVLWQAAYPDEVVPLMDEIAESYTIRSSRIQPMVWSHRSCHLTLD